MPRIVAPTSTGNVFADLDLPDAKERLAKAELASQISRIIRERGLTLTAAAGMLGIDQPKVSTLLAGRLTGFPLERLAHFLTLLGRDGVVQIHPAPRPRSSAEKAELRSTDLA